MNDWNASPPSGPFIQGACAIHTSTVAMRTCTRCGNFMCDECSQNRTLEVCPPCRAIVGDGFGAFPFRRDQWTFDGVLSYAWKVFTREWVLLSLAVLVAYVISFGISMITTGIRMAIFGLNQQSSASMGLGFALQIVHLVVQGGIQLGIVKLCLDAVLGRRLDFVDLFRQFSRLPAYLIQLLLLILVIGVPLAVTGGIGAGIGFASTKTAEAAIVGGIVGASVGFLLALPILLPSVFAHFELLYDRNIGGLASLKNCFTIASGFRAQIFLFSLLGIPILVAGVLLCCVGLLPAMAFWQLMLGVLYVALRRGSSLEGGPR